MNSTLTYQSCMNSTLPLCISLFLLLGTDIRAGKCSCMQWGSTGCKYQYNKGSKKSHWNSRTKSVIHKGLVRPQGYWKWEPGQVPRLLGPNSRSWWVPFQCACHYCDSATWSQLVSLLLYSILFLPHSCHFAIHLANSQFSQVPPISFS